MLADMEAMSAETVASIAWWFDLGDVVGGPMLAARGEQGRIWRLDTSRGSWAVKALLLPVQEAQAARDAEFQQVARLAGIPLPPPWRTRDGRVVLPVRQAAGALSMRVYQWAELAGGVVTAADIGAVTARMHRLPHDEDPGPPEAWFSEPIGETSWVKLLDAARRADAAWAVALARWLPELIALDATVTPPVRSMVRTCHRDLNIENVRRSAGGGIVVLDWENSGPAQPGHELATIICDLAADIAPLAARDCYAAYQEADGPARLSVTADFAMAVAVQGHLLQFYSRRALDPGEPEENRARSCKRLDHMLRQPLTQARADYLLDLINE